MRISNDPEFILNFLEIPARFRPTLPRQPEPGPPDPFPGIPDPFLPPGPVPGPIPPVQQPAGLQNENRAPVVIPEPYRHFTVDKQMSPVNRGELLARKEKTFNLKIQGYVRDRWPIYGSFLDRTNSWDMCFLKSKFYL